MNAPLTFDNDTGAEVQEYEFQEPVINQVRIVDGVAGQVDLAAVFNELVARTVSQLESLQPLVVAVERAPSPLLIAGLIAAGAGVAYLTVGYLENGD